MDLRRMSNWNVLSVEAALQQLNTLEDGNVEIKRPNTVKQSYRDSLICDEPPRYSFSCSFLAKKFNCIANRQG